MSGKVQMTTPEIVCVNVGSTAIAVGTALLAARLAFRASWMGFLFIAKHVK